MRTLLSTLLAARMKVEDAERRMKVHGFLRQGTVRMRERH